LSVINQTRDASLKGRCGIRLRSISFCAALTISRYIRVIEPPELTVMRAPKPPHARDLQDPESNRQKTLEAILPTLVLGEHDAGLKDCSGA
jgi:hypothetical protein